ncbi:MAG: carbon starvation protein A [Deltaproteobacteria bacterium]|nr:carbon starvation protein A [Deltaproteobacteria bacterium]
MFPILTAFFCLGALLLGYRFYSRFLSQQIFALRDDEKMPSKNLEDGVDYVPTDKHVLFGHHFSSIAGAAPILGPAMAIVWGFVPALIWIVVGVVFMGAAHDFGALVLSVRHEGKSVGSLAQRFIGPRSRILFLLVIFFLIWMVGAVFAFAIGGLFVKFPASILPVNLEIAVAMGIGWWGYKKGRSLTVPSLIALVGLYALIFATASGVVPVPQAGSILLDVRFWLVGLLIYAFIASSLPVWLLLQPRDLINSHQLIVGLVAMYLGFFFSNPTFAAPPVGELSALPAVFPLLFVTIACGAISGFHGLVSSGTTSKQLKCAKDARSVGYGSMLMEASLAILATLAVATGMMADGHTHVFEEIYVPLVKAGTMPTVPQALGGFVQGAASMLSGLGLPFKIGATVVAVLVISFAATSLDTALRIQRMVLAEIGDIIKVEPLKNRWIGGAIACSSVGVLIWADFEQRAKSLWPVFGATNQVLAAITLAMCALYLKRMKKNPLPYLVPAVVVMAITFIAMGIQVYRDLSQGHWLVGVVGAIIAVLSAWVAVEAMGAWRKVGAAVGEKVTT